MDPDSISVYTLPQSPPNYDRVGVFYITVCAAWSTLLMAGMGFLWFNRRIHILKIRGLPFSFAAIVLLHAYWILGQITYPIGATIPIVLAYDVQYFVMGIYLPLGIALFQASNSHFLHVAKQQKQFAHPDFRSNEKCDGASTSWLCRLRNMDYTKRIMTFISLGMAVQIILTIGMWLACRKYHPTFGVPGTEIQGTTLQEQVVELGRGWEWWPSVFWQVIWTWVVAPILIWRAWDIRDTMGWRTQTIGCCLSSLHATPMFLITSYSPAFAPVNVYFTPSQWIHLSIMMFEIFTIFVPVFQVSRLMILRKQAAMANAKWETASQTTTLRTATSVEWKSSSLALAEKGQSLDYFDEDNSDRLLTLNALEHVLAENPDPLQEFSALRDFSGENIAFLTRVTKWKGAWTATPTQAETKAFYDQALGIYTDFISPRDAEFPLNLSSQDLKRLEDIFERSARTVCGPARVNPATPFEVNRTPIERQRSGPKSGWIELAEVDKRTQYTGDIPAAFNMGVFDTVHSHVKYLVLTNTWPKFVNEMRQRRRQSTETKRSVFTASSQTTLASRASSFIRSIF